MIQTFCPHCGKGFRLTPDLAGRKLRCNGCSEKFRIPGADTESAPLPSLDLAQNRPIETRCPRCLADYSLKPKYAGQSVRCKTCRSPFVVPDLAATADDPELDDLIDVTPELHPARIAPERSSEFRPVSELARRPALPRKPEPEVVELTEDDMVDESTTGHDMLGDAAEMRAAARKGANRSALAPVSRMAYDSDVPALTRSNSRNGNRNSGSEFSSTFKKVASGILSVVICCSLTVLRYERRRMRNERFREAIQAKVEPKTDTGVTSIMRKAENMKFPDLPGGDMEPDISPGLNLLQQQMDSLQPKTERMRNMMRRENDRLRQKLDNSPGFPAPRFPGFRPGGPPGFGPGFPN